MLHEDLTYHPVSVPLHIHLTIDPVAVVLHLYAYDIPYRIEVHCTVVCCGQVTYALSVSIDYCST